MRKVAVALVSGLIVVALAAPAFAKTETLTGVLVDSSCYAKDKANSANAHPNMSQTCAQDCAKKGTPVQIVTLDGKVYTVTGPLAANNNQKLVPHMAHTMQLTGDTSEAGGKLTINASTMKMIGL
jgi:hypothetical protein